jgi:thioredoxin-like negative regulator of GroEL
MCKELKTIKELDDAVKENFSTLIYFFSDNCAPCISLRPKVQDLVHNDYPKMSLFFVNSEKFPTLPAQFGVFANPTLVVFFEGKEYKRVSKYISIPQLSELIARPYNMIFD